MLGRSLRPWAVAALLALVALGTATPWAARAQRGGSAGMLSRTQMVNAQVAAACTSLSCQQDYTGSASWVVTRAEGSRASNAPYLLAGGWTLYGLYSATNVCSLANGVQSSCTLRIRSAQAAYQCTTDLCKTFRIFSPELATSTDCTDAACVASHPPFLVPTGGIRVGDNSGIPGSFGSVTRSDGLQQVTYVSGQGSITPLYFCSCDLQPGDVKGGDVSDQWGFWTEYRP